jgi:hypothetical protein
MENIKKYYKNKEIFVVGALDSLGVPYTKDNNEMKSYIELTVDELKNNGINLTYFNMSSLGRNKTWELQEILARDYTIGEYNKWNKNASRFVIDGKRKEESWPFPTNPEFIDNFYEITPNPSIHITSKLSEVNAPIFLYSCGGMNIRKYLNINSEMTGKDILLCAREVLLRCVKHIKQTKLDVDNTINQIRNLNPNMEIYVLGVYAMLDDQRLRDLVFPLVNLYNYELNKVIAPYDNVHYVDITEVKNMVAEKDMHPTLEGQKYISHQLIKVMDESCSKIKR